jgi:hypothetical protein
MQRSFTDSYAGLHLRSRVEMLKWLSASFARNLISISEELPLQFKGSPASLPGFLSLI